VNFKRILSKHVLVLRCSSPIYRQYHHSIMIRLKVCFQAILAQINRALPLLIVVANPNWPCYYVVGCPPGVLKLRTLYLCCLKDMLSHAQLNIVGGDDTLATPLLQRFTSFYYHLIILLIKTRHFKISVLMNYDAPMLVSQ